MSVRLTLVCHAATCATRAAVFPLDEKLEPQGEAKAKALATELSRVDLALTSPALRASQTASALGLDASIEPALRDIDLGRWAGRTFDDVQAAEPDAVGLWTCEADAAPHGGESVADLLCRVAPWLSGLSGKTGRIVAVTHPAVIRAAVMSAIDAGPSAFWRIDVAPLCRVNLVGNGPRWNLKSIIPLGV
jgi:broad specificity phosphatase PhoE